MQNPNPNALLIQSLLDDGELLPPTLVLDGIVMTAAGTGAGGPPQYDAAGWSLTGTEIGGRASQGGDALLVELTTAGGVNADISTYLQAHASKVISRFYAPPCAFGFAAQDGRFSTPASFAPLTADAFHQSIINGVAFNNAEFFTTWSGGEAAVRDLYRGATGGTPDPIVNKATQYDPNATTWIQSGVTFYDYCLYNVLGGFKGAAYITYGRVDPSKHITGHIVLDAFTDTQTDANWTRKLRSIARAMGATIPA